MAGRAARWGPQTSWPRSRHAWGGLYAQVDLAPGNIPRAAQKYPRPNLHFLHMEGTALAFPDGAFDVVCSFQVIEHIPEARLQQHLIEVKRVLAPDGVYCLTTLNLDHNMKPGHPYEKLRFHEKEFTAPELHALLRQGFPNVQLLGLYLTWQHALAQRLKKWGLMRLGPARFNPVARFYERIGVEDFATRSPVSRAALDLIALCRKTPFTPAPAAPNPGLALRRKV